MNQRTRQRWTVRIAVRADQDFVDILRWTTRAFGRGQARVYARTLSLAIEALAAGPDLPGARSREEIAPGIRTLHVGRQGRNGRHFVVFRVAQERTIDVLRLLHDSMDLARQIGEPPRTGH